MVTGSTKNTTGVNMRLGCFYDDTHGVRNLRTDQLRLDR